MHSSNRTQHGIKNKATIALQCKLNGKQIAALFFIPCSSLIWGYSPRWTLSLLPWNSRCWPGWYIWSAWNHWHRGSSLWIDRWGCHAAATWRASWWATRDPTGWCSWWSSSSSGGPRNKVNMDTIMLYCVLQCLNASPLQVWNWYQGVLIRISTNLTVLLHMKYTMA